VLRSAAPSLYSRQRAVAPGAGNPRRGESKIPLIFIHGGTPMGQSRFIACQSLLSSCTRLHGILPTGGRTAVYRAIARLALVCCIVAASRPATTRALEVGPAVFVLSGSGIGVSQTQTAFGYIDSDTGVYTEITNRVDQTPANTYVGNLAWNPAISAFYVQHGVTLASTLRTLTIAGTLSSPIGSNIDKSMYGMALREADNTLYGFASNFNDTGTISPTGGGWTTLNSSPGPTSGLPSGGRYAILGDTMYMAYHDGTDGFFGTMGYTASSTFQQVGSTNNAFTHMVLAADGSDLYGVYGNPATNTYGLYTINPLTGVPTLEHIVTGLSGVNLYGAGIATSSVVPEIDPAGIAGAIAVVVGAVGLLERRRLMAKSA
jgi:hypothetical protein